jgi:tripartite ATP-independent transporter DctM subunit
MNVVVLMIAFFAALLVGVPVVWSLALSSIFVLVFGDLALPMPWLAQQFLRGADSITLASVPLFLLAGGLMNHGGLTRRIIAFAEVLLGGLRGGLGPVNVATAMVYGGVTGSATADTGAVGSILIPAMAERGYPKAFSAAVTAAGGTLGIIIPPSVVMILYGVITGTSIGGLFAAGVLPGIMIGLVFMVTAWLIGVHRQFPKLDHKNSWSVIVRNFFAAAPALLMPIVVIGSLLGGFATPTEAAAVAVVYALLVGMLIYRELAWVALPKIARESAITTGAIMIILAAATPFSWILTVEQVPLAAANLVNTYGATPAMAIGGLILLLLFVGLWMDLGPALLILAPIVKPIGLAAGLDPLQLGLVVTIGLGIGLFTPPVGTNIFVVANIAKVPMGEIIMELIPFWFMSVLCLVLVAFVPALTTALPRALGF